MWKENCKNLNSNGITLIALVIMIIVLLILAGVTIATLIGENGIFIQAQKAKEETTEAESIERIQVEVLSSYGADGNIDINLLKENLNNIQGIGGVDNIAKLPTVITLGGKYYRIKNDGKVGKYESELPSGYTELEYIECTGTQYIDTNYIPNNATGMNVTISNYSNISSNDVNFIGSRATAGQRFMINYYYGQLGFGFGDFTNTKKSIDWSAINTFSLNYKNNRKFIFEADEYSIDKITATLPTVCIFKQNGSSIRSTYRVYKFSLTQEESIIMDLIPALDKNGTPCMYDTISKQTFYNQGTGEFLYKEKEL